MPDRLEGQGEGGLTVFRAEHLNDRLGIIDPHARLFVTEGTRRYARIANAVDAALMGRSLARFQRFGERMASAAGRMEQLLILGVGFDTRALWLPEIVESGVRVFEIDLPATIERKVRVLAENGILYPEHVVPVGIDLASPDLRTKLEAAGFDPSRPAALLIEGVTFHLEAKTLRFIIDPGGLGLVAGSELSFDYWTRDRVDRRNKLLPRSPMQHFSLPEDPEPLRAALEGLGYRDVSIRPLSELAARLGPDLGHDKLDWYLVEATVA